MAGKDVTPGHLFGASCHVGEGRAAECASAVPSAELAAAARLRVQHRDTLRLLERLSGQNAELRGQLQQTREQLAREQMAGRVMEAPPLSHHQTQHAASLDSGSSLLPAAPTNQQVPTLCAAAATVEAEALHEQVDLLALQLQGQRQRCAELSLSLDQSLVRCASSDREVERLRCCESQAKADALQLESKCQQLLEEQRRQENTCNQLEHARTANSNLQADRLRSCKMICHKFESEHDVLLRLNASLTAELRLREEDHEAECHQVCALQRHLARSRRCSEELQGAHQDMESLSLLLHAEELRASEHVEEAVASTSEQLRHQLGEVVVEMASIHCAAAREMCWRGALSAARRSDGALRRESLHGLSLSTCCMSDTDLGASWISDNGWTDGPTQLTGSVKAEQGSHDWRDKSEAVMLAQVEQLAEEVVAVRASLGKLRAHEGVLELASRTAESQAAQSQDALCAATGEMECWQQQARGTAARLQEVEAELHSAVSIRDSCHTQLEVLGAASRNAANEATQSQEALQAACSEAESWQQKAAGATAQLEEVEAELHKVFSMSGSRCSELEAACRSATGEAMRSQVALRAARNEADCWQQQTRGSFVRIEAVEADLHSAVSMKDSYRAQLDDAILAGERLKQEAQEERRCAADATQHLKEATMAREAAQQAEQQQQRQRQHQQQQSQSGAVADSTAAAVSALREELAESRHQAQELTAALLAEQADGSRLRCQLRELRGESRLSICSAASRASSIAAVDAAARTCDGKEAAPMPQGLSGKGGPQPAGASGEGARLEAVRQEFRNKAGGQPLTDVTFAWQRAQVLEDGITCKFGAFSSLCSPRQTDRSHAHGASRVPQDLENTPVRQRTESDDVFLNGELLFDQDILSHSNRLSLTDTSRTTISSEDHCSPAGSHRLTTTSL